MPIADRNEQLQPGTPPTAPQFRQIVDALMSQPMAKPRLGTGQPPMWGFHEPTVQAGAGVDAAMQAAPQVLSDPRNAWFGLGPIAGMARPIQGVGGWMRSGMPPRDLGGFKPPVSHLPDMGLLTNQNELAQGLLQGGQRRENIQNLIEGTRDLAPTQMDNIYQAEQGLRQLKAERDMAMFGGGSAGGAIPPRSIMDDLQGKYGFGQQAQDTLYEGYRQNSLPTTRPRPNTRKPPEE